MRMTTLAALLAAAFSSGVWAQTAGPSSSQAPYVTPTAPGWSVTSVLTVGDSADNGFRMVGIPDGLGAFDNGDDTFTVLMNHELGPAAGVARSHGNTGAFVSELVLRKTDLRVLAGRDLARDVRVWDAATSAYIGAVGQKWDAASNGHGVRRRRSHSED